MGNEFCKGVCVGEEKNLRLSIPSKSPVEKGRTENKVDYDINQYLVNYNTLKNENLIKEFCEDSDNEKTSHEISKKN